MNKTQEQQNLINKGRFITLEGIEGAGKTTAITFISDYLKNKDIRFIVTREPGGTEIAEKIRHVVLGHHSESMHPDTELLLFFAARAQHLNIKIKPALERGEWVISDRFTDTSYAYQGIGRNIPQERIAVLENWVQGDLRPDLTFIFDISPELSVKRSRSKNLDRIEVEEIGFFRRIRNFYLTMAQNNPNRYKIIDAAKSISKVKQQISTILENI